MGAIISLLTLAMGPFLQQLLQTKMTPVSQGEATLPTTKLLQDFPPWVYAGSNELDTAIFEGMFTARRVQHPVAPACSATTNCTWDKPYRTLAVCSACMDLSDQIKYRPKPDQGQAARIKGGPSLPPPTNLNTTVDQFYDDSGIVYVSVIGRDPNESSTQIKANNCTLQLCSRLFTAEQNDGKFEETEHGQPLVFERNSCKDLNQTTRQGNFEVRSSALDLLRWYFIVSFDVALTGLQSYGGSTTPGSNGESADHGALLQQALFSPDLTIDELTQISQIVLHTTCAHPRHPARTCTPSALPLEWRRA